jgi:hypothetical protein
MHGSGSRQGTRLALLLPAQLGCTHSFLHPINQRRLCSLPLGAMQLPPADQKGVRLHRVSGIHNSARVQKLCHHHFLSVLGRLVQGSAANLQWQYKSGGCQAASCSRQQKSQRHLRWW